MRFVNRANWGAHPPRNRSGIGDVRGVTLHWGGDHLGNHSHGRCYQIIRSWQNYHMDTNGWSDLGYNAVACIHGYVFEGRGIGVRGAHAGASNIGGNDDWYGLCAMVGPGDTITDDLLDALRDGITWFRNYGAGDRVNGHRDHHATACPGDELYRWTRGDIEEDDVSARDVWSWDKIQVPWKSKNDENRHWQTRHALASTWDNAYKAHVHAREMHAQVTGMSEAIKALAESRGLSGEEMTQIVSAAVRGELDAFEAKLADAEVVLDTEEDQS